jgi:hypothetical protein
MPTPASTPASRRFMLGMLAALPTLPTLFGANRIKPRSLGIRRRFQPASSRSSLADEQLIKMVACPDLNLRFNPANSRFAAPKLRRPEFARTANHGLTLQCCCST